MAVVAYMEGQLTVFLVIFRYLQIVKKSACYHCFAKFPEGTGVIILLLAQGVASAENYVFPNGIRCIYQIYVVWSMFLALAGFLTPVPLQNIQRRFSVPFLLGELL